MTVPILGERQEQHNVIPCESVPEDYLVHARIGKLDVYAEQMVVDGPVVRFLGAYASEPKGHGLSNDEYVKYERKLNLMCFYASVCWYDCPQPWWWDVRDQPGSLDEKLISLKHKGK